MKLRPYQQECLERIRGRYKKGARRLLVSLPTGTGKTVVFAAMPRERRTSKAGRAEKDFTELVLVDSDLRPFQAHWNGRPN
jgi:superfamily II DNA or RNA helicase